MLSCFFPYDSVAYGGHSIIHVVETDYTNYLIFHVKIMDDFALYLFGT